MPIPSPKKDEKHDVFISRCMGDNVMVKEYGDTKQRYAVCESSWGKIHKNEELQTFKFNIASDTFREEKFDEEDYLVFPAIMCTPCVMNSLYYPAEILSLCPKAWNGRPVTVRHPHGAVGSPDVLEEFQIGLLFETRFEDNKLKTEVWIEKNKSESKIPDLFEKLKKGIMVNVSTGVFVTKKDEFGVFNNKEYTGIVKTLIPDHLAILPEEEGACSIKDGAGIPRTNRKEGNNVEMEINEKALVRFLKFIANKAGFTINELSTSELFTKMNDIIEKTFSGFLLDIYKEYVVFSKNDKKYKVNYSIEENEIKLDTTIVEVIHKYEEVVSKNKEGSNEMDPKIVEVVNALIATGSFEESDRSILEKKNLDSLNSLLEKLVEKPEEKKNEEKVKETEEKIEEKKNEEKPPVVNIPDVAKLIDVDKIVQIVTNAILKKNEDAERETLVAALKSNENCFLSEDALKIMPINDLKALHMNSISRVDFGLRSYQTNAKQGVPDPIPLVETK